MRRVVAVAVVIVTAVLSAAASAREPHVLRVGSYHGIAGNYKTIQAAIDAAKPYDWILVGPGDYKTTSISYATGARRFPAGLLITTPDLRLRGMNRNAVVVDGTKSGPRCNGRAGDQNFGLRSAAGATGLNGIMIWKADDVWVQNLTACNFLGGSGGDGKTGNEIWWNGGEGSGSIGGWGYEGSYLTATSNFYRGESSAAEYGIFSSNWDGGTWTDSYASNFNDSGFYIGACQRLCNQTIDDGWAQYNAIGYSGTNSGGRLLIEHSQFDENEDGFDTNGQNNDDWPSPQSGACPAGVRPPIAGAHSCWVFDDNDVHDNNNPNVPSAGAAAAGPVGTGMSIEGRDDTVLHNVFSNNGAWGVVFQPYPDTETPPPDATACAGGTSHYEFVGIDIGCVYDDWDDALIANTFTHNGFFANPTNGDFAQSTFFSGHPVNCFSANTDTGGPLTSSPANLEASNPSCGPVAPGADQNLTFVLQSLCDTQVFGPGTPCPAGASYPRRKKVVMQPLPKGLATMPDPCRGVPANPWCPARRRSGD